MSEQEAKRVDVVCGMELGPEVRHTSEYAGKTYSFCSKSCKEHFDENPEKYVKESSPAQ